MNRFRFRVWIPNKLETSDYELNIGWLSSQCEWFSLSEGIICWGQVDGSRGLKIGKECIVEFSTGLLDKNGKEIYEGDVVKDRDGKGIVVFNPSTASFVVKCEDCEFDYYAFNKGVTDRDTQLEDTEIIGNIHEEAQ